ncbi:hypothetical protein [Nonomuraea sp. NPDC049625]|uniref:ATP-binding protein n=1 Tax=Nonomuraea sp. NPDC049625 TaxID=3155775 RepID=UPI003431427D
MQGHQRKIIEESSAPGLPDDVRHALWEAAVTGARAIGLRNIGTFGFFMETNARLHIEHPVTSLHQSKPTHPMACHPTPQHSWSEL